MSKQQYIAEKPVDKFLRDLNDEIEIEDMNILKVIVKKILH